MLSIPNVDFMRCLSLHITFTSLQEFYFLYDLYGCGLYFPFLLAFFCEMNMNYRDYFNSFSNHAARFAEWIESGNCSARKQGGVY